jgi:hypothetical protein
MPAVMIAKLRRCERQREQPAACLRVKRGHRMAL